MFKYSDSVAGRRTTLTTLAVVAVIVSFVMGSAPAAHAKVAPAVVGPLTAGASFNSSFNGSHGGWSVVFGPWKQGTSYFTTVGKDGTDSSIKHSGTYHNFVYSAKMKRTSSSTASYEGLIVRGSPSMLTTLKYWTNQYYLEYTTGGFVDVGKLVNGVTSLLFRAQLGVVNAQGWNVLKVVAYDDMLAFYVNGTKVYQTSDLSFAKGSVGIDMYRDPGSINNKLVVDWAKLQVISLDLDPFSAGDTGIP